MSAAPSKLDLVAPSGKESERLTLERDINKAFDLNEVFERPYVLIDFFRDMYGSLRLEDGRYITNGLEVQQYGARKLGLTVVDKVEATDPVFAPLWLENFKRFCDLANKSSAQFLIVPVYQLAAFWNETEFRIEPGWRPKQIVTRNLILGSMQRIALALLDNALLVPILPETLELDPNHEFGPGPYHFSRAAYVRATEMLATLPEYTTTLDASPERRAEIVATELRTWTSQTGAMASPPQTKPPAEPIVAKTETGSDHSIIEMVLPLRAENGNRGSDLRRARDGLIPSLNWLCDPAFATSLTIVVPSEDFAAGQELASTCKLPTRVIAEDDLIPTGHVGPSPRRGWYIQQLIKLAYAQICKTNVYMTLNADLVLLNKLNHATMADGKPPMKVESTSAHLGWWRESAKLLERPSIADRDPENGFGITPAFYYTDVVRDLISDVGRIAVSAGKNDWIQYLAAHVSSGENTWTDTSLYWTYYHNTHAAASNYSTANLYYYTHYGWRAETLLTKDEEYQKFLFCVLQSAYVDEASHSRFVSKFAAMTRERILS